MVSVGYAELEEKLRGTSRLADYLIDQLVEWNATVPVGEPLSTAPWVTRQPLDWSGSDGRLFRTVPAPRFGREGGYLPGAGHPIRVFDQVDVRYLLEDMFAKIRLFGREEVSRLGH
ncbi:hypothetical protein FOJ82_10520 [Tessaracoccus rhinocerotis]|uniref:Uncharacterized protein n=1 Tax=Tessaracoccus rhinocerotis TaxID=1689449 RepID=A0A553JZ30_9ACTN|nr:hypothetical protein [Tessaracoccus rhinocerotis]TRY17709.1 hypothetical protein FOJ82_10520 [Tessaracoccus rhinocerotis]